MSGLAELVTTLILQPGDKLLFNLGEYDPSEEEIAEFRRTIAWALPGVPFLVVSGGVSVSVVRGEDAE